ncbi:SIS domain-containing protein [bacterium]|nr:MAG: SIS domain-containing protein [bacterium]
MLDQLFRSSLSSAVDHLRQFSEDESVRQSLVALTQRLCQMDAAGGKVLIAGNGGSMADAMHFAEEWTGCFRNHRRALPALALADPTHLSCVSNDFGFARVFSRMVEAFGQPHDVLILLSTSGNSENLVLAAEAAKERGLFVVGFLGKGGGKLLPLCDLAVMAPGQTSDRIQELHMLALHIVIEAVEVELKLA